MSTALVDSAGLWLVHFQSLAFSENEDMPAYVTQSQLQSEIPEPDLIDALDDDKDGQADETAWEQILATASTDVDALLGSRYTVPLAEPEDWDAETKGAWALPSPVQSAAFAFAGEKIYKRRRTPDDQNPFFKRAEFWRSRLAKIGAGELALEATATNTGPAANYGGRAKLGSRLDTE